MFQFSEHRFDIDHRVEVACRGHVWTRDNVDQHLAAILTGTSRFLHNWLYFEEKANHDFFRIVFQKIIRDMIHKKFMKRFCIINIY